MAGWFPGKSLVCATLIVRAAYAQTSGGVFRGEVRDPSHAIVPEAKIVIRSNDSGVQVSVASNGDGLYVSSTVIPGSYTLSATKPGFETEVFGPVTLEVNQTVRVDFALNIGAASVRSQVEASGAQLLSTESAEVSQVIVSKQVSQIPLNGRAWQQLIDLSAGVNPGAPGQSGSPNPVNINGQRDKANLYLVDGISTTSSTEGRGNDFNIPLDAVREFSVEAGSYSAEYGNVAGGVINLQTRSGTNQWHGSLFEFFRNDSLDAADFFSNQTGQPKNALRYNQFGGVGWRSYPARQDLRLCRLPGHRHARRSTGSDECSSGGPAQRQFLQRYGCGSGPDLRSIGSFIRAHAVSKQHHSGSAARMPQPARSLP